MMLEWLKHFQTRDGGFFRGSGASQDGVKELSLRKCIIHNEAGAEFEDGDNSLNVVTSAQRWSYAISFPIIHKTWSLRTKYPLLILLDLAVQDGEIGVGCCDSSMKNYITDEVYISREAEDGPAMILVEKPVSVLNLIIRNVNGEEKASHFSLRRISLRDGVKLDKEQYMGIRLRGLRSKYRHYSFDLPGKFLLPATYPEKMAFHHLNRKVLRRLMEEAFGPFDGQKVIDVGCSSGFHAFAMARDGLDIVGIDRGRDEIDQAKFVQVCSDNLDEKRCRFHHADFFSFRSTEEQYDWVHCSGVLYHLEDIVGAARKIHYIAKYGAIIHSSVSSMRGKSLSLADSTKFSFCFDGEFSFVPTGDILVDIFKHVGFKEVSIFTGKDMISEKDLDTLPKEDRDYLMQHTCYLLVKK